VVSISVSSIDCVRVLLFGKEAAMLRLNVLLANFVVLSASLLSCQVVTSQGPETAPQVFALLGSVEPTRVSLLLELDRAILVLKQGLKEHWPTRDQYLTAFEKTPDKDPNGRSVTDAKSYVERAIGVLPPNHEVWDENWNEGPPIKVAVQRAIDKLAEWRKCKSIGSNQLFCAAPVPRKVAVSAGVAATMLKTKIDPVYPAEALENHISGTVALHVTLSTEGGVKAFRVISGPASLRQSALDAVQKWTYRPYLLNGMPVEVETTVNVVFAPNR
jgi:TonB family protein